MSDRATAASCFLGPVALLLGHSFGCSADSTLLLPGGDFAGGPSPVVGAAKAEGGDGQTPIPTLPGHCVGAAVPPQNLECTGLYSDVANKQTMPGVREYAPALSLWSDGASKQRWVSLPPGTLIDNSDPNEWAYPVGTKFFKEFSQNGQRVETRLWQKADDNFWVNATYQWDASETEAVRTPGGEIRLPTGEPYNIPTRDECDKCHRGRTERILGFEEVLLGLDGAQGVTLDALVEEKLLSDPPSDTHLEVVEDGTGSADALGWLHVNCGISCHNPNTRSVAYGTGMFLRLEAKQLESRSVASFDSYSTTVGQDVHTSNWRGWLRVDPGQPSTSLLYDLIMLRGEGPQMPPFGTDVVDERGGKVIERWIRSMPPATPSGP